MYTPYGNTAGIGRIVQRSNQHLRSTFQLLWSRNVFNDTIQQRSDCIGWLLPVGTHPVVFGRTVDNGEIQLVFRRIKTEHQVEYHFVNLFRATIRLIHLIDYDNGFQTDFQCFLQYETGLRHGTFKGVYQQNTAIGHIQHTFYFTTEVTMSRSINNINFGTVVVDGNVFRKNRYTTFTFQIVVVQYKFTTILVVAEQVSRQ